MVLKGGSPDEAWRNVLVILSTMLGIYALGWIASLLLGQFGAVLTQRFLRDMRNEMFDKMEKLPIKYFDRNAHGDIMSIYTNDIDAIRQLVSQSLPQLCMTTITLVTLTFVMLYYSIILWAIVVVGVIAILFLTKKIGGKSAKYFMAQQRSVGKVEGYIEEMMNGQKVVKVFCHEEKTLKGFDVLNEELFDVSDKANGFSNMLMPIIHNIGNIMYVVIAFIGCGIYIMSNGQGINIGFEGLIKTGHLFCDGQINEQTAHRPHDHHLPGQISKIGKQAGECCEKLHFVSSQKRTPRRLRTGNKKRDPCHSQKSL